MNDQRPHVSFDGRDGRRQQIMYLTTGQLTSTNGNAPALASSSSLRDHSERQLNPPDGSLQFPPSYGRNPQELSRYGLVAAQGPPLLAARGDQGGNSARFHGTPYEHIAPPRQWVPGPFHGAPYEHIAPPRQWVPGPFHGAPYEHIAPPRQWVPGPFHGAPYEHIAPPRQWIPGPFNGTPYEHIAPAPIPRGGIPTPAETLSALKNASTPSTAERIARRNARRRARYAEKKKEREAEMEAEKKRKKELEHLAYYHAMKEKFRKEGLAIAEAREKFRKEGLAIAEARDQEMANDNNDQNRE